MPPIMVTIEPRILSIFEHVVPFECPFLDPHLTTYHPNIAVHIIAMLDYHWSYLPTSDSWRMTLLMNKWILWKCWMAGDVTNMMDG